MFLKKIIPVSIIGGLAISACTAIPAYAQSKEGAPRPKGEPKAVAYMPEGTVDYRLLVGPPPVKDGIIDRIDMAISYQFQLQVSEERWKMAELDDAMVYPRYDEAVGKKIDRQTSPALIHLLNRVLKDVADPVWHAKRVFQRPRPFQRYQLTRRCGDEPIPAPERDPKTGSSYPSGHTVYGWATGLILAEVAPDRAPIILDRAREYALSRVICGYHFPSDTEAARAVASSVVTRLHDMPEFMADLQAAKTEYASGHAAPATAASSPVEGQPD